METMEKNTIEMALGKAMSYMDYRDLVDSLFANGKSTGDTQTEAYLNYTDLNIHRMNKWDKHYHVSAELEDQLKKLSDRETWLVITEGWCGDAAHAVPVIHKMADSSQNVEMKVVLRDENPELMDMFLTDGARSIPKLIRLSETGEVLGTWGPRPVLGQKIIDDAKVAGTPIPTAKEALQLWYARDKGKTIASEISEILK